MLRRPPPSSCTSTPATLPAGARSKSWLSDLLWVRFAAFAIILNAKIPTTTLGFLSWIWYIAPNSGV